MTSIWESHLKAISHVYYKTIKKGEAFHNKKCFTLFISFKKELMKKMMIDEVSKLHREYQLSFLAYEMRFDRKIKPRLIRLLF